MSEADSNIKNVDVYAGLPTKVEDLDLDVLFDWLNDDLDDVHTEALVRLVAGLDPFEQDGEGNYKYDEVTRDVITEARAKLNEASS